MGFFSCKACNYKLKGDWISKSENIRFSINSHFQRGVLSRKSQLADEEHCCHSVWKISLSNSETKMGVDDVPMDDKAKRMRDLLSSFYSPDPSSPSKTPNASSRFATLDTINTTTFDVDQYMNLLVCFSSIVLLHCVWFIVSLDGHLMYALCCKISKNGGITMTDGL